jgi:hypothetical protein
VLDGDVHVLLWHHRDRRLATNRGRSLWAVQ